LSFAKKRNFVNLYLGRKSWRRAFSFPAGESRLSAEENLWLKSLTNDLEGGAAKAIPEGRKEVAREAPLNAYIDLLLRANPEAFMEAWNMEHGKGQEDI
jgi:hypothetical protein